MTSEKLNSKMIDDNNPSVFIGYGTLIKGSIEVPGEIIINGTFEGDLKAKQLTVGEKGHVIGSTDVHTVKVYGKMDQKLISTTYIHIFATGSVKGHMVYDDIDIAKGGTVEGTLNHRSSN